MADSVLLTYIGATTGIIGAVTGIAGSILGYIAYKRSNELKSLDLRLELRKNINTIHTDIQELMPLIERTNKSRYAVASATGMLNSGSMTKWDSDYASDRAIIDTLTKNIPNLQETYTNLTTVDLESKIIEMHGLHDKVSRLHQKFNESLAADDRSRTQIAASKISK